ncbi:hypothetical protein PP836_004873 [Salmonella enterica]|nr:hypothetical protein [Salmonella enterica subsp. diarizonae]EGV3636875.1 hypothetical protein [Salmonella enterica]EKL0444756.1 hypothetical protein [Salmonella enterica]HCM1889981.1 hypothetical protein [Salmonella enterica subsp. diarizonae serovar 57:c:z]
MKFIYFSLFLPFTVNAFTVDSMVKVAGKENYFFVSGNSNDREYLYITLSELISDKNNRSHEVVFDATNVAAWPVVAEPADVIVSAGEQVKIKIIKNYVSSGNDRIFGITFTPDVLDENSDKKYNLPLGYKSWFIVPGTDPVTGSPEVRKGERTGDYIISNNTNKVMNVKINYCTHTDEKDCTAQLITRPYSNKKFSLGNNVSSAEITFYTVSADQNNKPVKKIKL